MTNNGAVRVASYNVYAHEYIISCLVVPGGFLTSYYVFYLSHYGWSTCLGEYIAVEWIAGMEY